MGGAEGCSSGSGFVSSGGGADAAGDDDRPFPFSSVRRTRATSSAVNPTCIT